MVSIKILQCIPVFKVFVNFKREPNSTSKELVRMYRHFFLSVSLSVSQSLSIFDYDTDSDSDSGNNRHVPSCKNTAKRDQPLFTEPSILTV